MVKTQRATNVCGPQYGVSSVGNDTYVTDSYYDPVTKRTYITGSFLSVGTAVGLLAAVDVDTGEPVSFAKVFSQREDECVIWKVIADPDNPGGFFAAGMFTHAVGVDSDDAVIRYNIVKIRPDLSIDPDFIPIVNSAIVDMAFVQATVGGSRLFIGGNFTMVNNQPRQWFAALDPETGELDTNSAYELGFLPTTGRLNVVLNPPGTSQIIIGGNFTAIGSAGVTHSHINLARINTNPTPGLDSTFLLNAVGGQGVFWAVCNAGGVLTYAGGFSTSNGLSRSRVAQAIPPYSNDAADVTAFNPSPDNTVNVMKESADGSSIIIAGDFTTISGTSRPSGIAAYANSNNGALLPLNPDLETFAGVSVADSHAGYSIDGSSFYVSGAFEKVDGVERLGLAKVDSDGILDPSFTANISKMTTYSITLGGSGTSVKGMLHTGSTLLIYGSPRIINSVRRTCVAAFEADGSLSDYNPEITLPFDGFDVMDVHCDTNGDVYFVMEGHASTLVNGISRRGGFATDSDGVLLPWNPITSASGSLPEAVYVHGSRVYIGGSLLSVDGSSAWEHFAATDKSTGSLIVLPTNPRPNDWVITICANDTYVMIGGYFDEIQDTIGTDLPRNGFAVLNHSGDDQGDWEVSGTQLGDTYVSKIRQADDGNFYMAGYFTSVEGQPREAVFSLDATGTLRSWSSDLFDQGSDGLGIAYNQLTILVTGMCAIDGSNFGRLAELDLNGDPTEFNLIICPSNGIGSQQHIYTIQKTPSNIYGFGDLRIANTSTIIQPFPNLNQPFTVAGGGQIAQQIATYQLLSALNLAGSSISGGRYEVLLPGDSGTDNSGTPLLGPTGIGGITGLPGPTGAFVLGATGISPRGNTGIQGASGLRGATGLRGVTGFIGITGAGLRGATGLTGQTGIVGLEKIDYTFSTNIAPTGVNTLLPIDTTGGPMTVTLPLAASVGAGKYFYIYDVGTYPTNPGQFSAGTGFSYYSVTVVTSGSDTINGTSSLLLNAFGEFVFIISNGVSRYTASIPAARVIGAQLPGPTGIQGITGVEFI